MAAAAAAAVHFPGPEPPRELFPNEHSQLPPPGGRTARAAGLLGRVMEKTAAAAAAAVAVD